MTRRVAALLVWAWALLGFGAVHAVWAEDEATSDDGDATLRRASDEARAPTLGLPWSELGRFDREMAVRALASVDRRGAQVRGGERVADVLVVRLPVVLEDDPWPYWINRFHVLSREAVVDAGIALSSGDAWSDTLWRDSRRAMTDTSIYATVLVLPLEPTSGRVDEVDVLVVVRDIWSLRINFFPAAAGALTNVHLSVVDTNIAGSNGALGVAFDLRQGDWLLGPMYTTRRFARTRLLLYDQLRFQVEREGRLEGVTQTFELAQPLYDTTFQRAWRFGASWSNLEERRFQGDRLRRFSGPTSEGGGIDETWRERMFRLDGGMTFAGGTAHRWRIEPIFAVQWQESSLTAVDSSTSEAVVEAFRREVLPPSRRDVGPGVRVGWERNRFFDRTNVHRFRLAEEFRDGGWAEATVVWLEPTLQSRVRGAHLRAEVGWSGRLGEDAMWSAGAGWSGRVEQGEGWVDQSASAFGRWVSPSAWAGRWVAEVRGRQFFENDANERLLLGADTGLRGWATGAFVASTHARWNVEWRSRSVEVLRTWWGVAAFSDGVWLPDGDEVGGVFPAVGFGVRVAAPQSGTVVRGVDIGFPMRDGVGIRSSGFLSQVPRPILSIRIDQAF
jgi:hypothetical protein